MPSQCDWWTWTWTCRLLYFDRWYHLRSSIILFSLLRAINYHYNMGPIIAENIMILTIHEGLFCIIFLHSKSTGLYINIDFISFYKIVPKMDKMCHCRSKYNDILILAIFQIEISSIIFSKIPNLQFLCIFCHNFWGSQIIS